MILAPDFFVAMDWFEQDAPIRVDLVYAQANHPRNIFKTALYAPNAQLWLHKDLAKIVLRAAHRLNANFGWSLILYDGLRTLEAQERMHRTDTVRIDNPDWGTPGNPYLSLPGEGGHPRGMAVDIGAEGIDMGTLFDEMTPASARDYTGFDRTILTNRTRLEMAMRGAAATLNLPLLPLPSEWWDFRFPKDISNEYDAVRDAGLPPFMRICAACDRARPSVWQTRFDKARSEVLNSLSI